MRPIALLIAILVSLCGTAQDYYLFVGTYTSGKSKGIYVYDLNIQTAAAKSVSYAESKNPSYLAIASNGKFLYSVNEGGNDSYVSAFAFDRKSGKLSFINKQ